MEGILRVGFLRKMKNVISKIASWRIQTEIRLKSWTIPTVGITLILGGMSAAIVWSLSAGRSPGLAACVMGVASFGGMFLIAWIMAGVLMARKPEQVIEDLLREPARTYQSQWKQAQLAEAKRHIQNRGSEWRRQERPGTTTMRG